MIHSPVRRPWWAAALTGLATLLTSMLVAPGAATPASAGEPAGLPAVATKQLTGTLVLAPGAFDTTANKYTGSYFRMILPGGVDQYFTNPDANAADKTYTLFRPGTDGGLQLGRFQPPPTPAFVNGDSQARRIVLPEKFAGIYFSITTAPTDAQGGQPTPAPSLQVQDGRVTGNLSGWTPGWNSIYFNQGSPKPDGSYPGFTKAISGTYDASTHAFEIVWYSLIVGGPFNGFTGYWHLQGTVADNTLALTPAPSAVSVKRGKAVAVKVSVVNGTEGKLAASSIAVTAPTKLKLSGSKKAAVPALDAGAGATVTLNLAAGKKAKPGKYKVKLSWKAAGKSASGAVTVTVKK